jgi:hypothetical protein
VLVSVLLAVPVLALMAMRINAALVLLSLCLGDVIMRFASDDASQLIGTISSYGMSKNAVVSLVLLLLPPILTAIFMIRTVRGGLGLLLNLVPAISVSVIGLLIAEPLFAPGLRGSIEQTIVWHYVTNLQTMVVLVSGIFSILIIWTQRPKRKHHDEEGKHHK